MSWDGGSVARAAIELVEAGHDDRATATGLAEWVSRTWPPEGNVTEDDARLLHRLNWHLGAAGTTMVEWLASFPGNPAVLSTALQTISTCRTVAVEHVTSLYGAAVAARTGVGPEDVAPRLVAAIEVPVVFHDLDDAARGSMVALVSVYTAISAALDAHPDSQGAAALNHTLGLVDAQVVALAANAALAGIPLAA